MFKLSPKKIFLAASALLLCAGFAQATTPPVSPITATPNTVSLTYQLPSTPGNPVPVALTVASGTADFVVDPTTVPSWLSIDDTADTAVVSPGLTINLVASSAAAGLTAGVYSTSVHIRVSGFQDLVLPVSLSVNDPASTLSVMNGGTAVANNGTVALSWIYGSTPLPTSTLTILSSDEPVAFTAAETVTSPAAPTTWIQLSAATGIAYNFGTPLTVTFLPDVLQNAKVGDHLTGQVTVSYGSGPTVIHVNYNITVAEPNAAITSIFPNYTPLHSSGTLTVVVTGSGFGTLAQGYTSKTVVSIAYGAVASTDLTMITGGAINVVNPTTLILTIPHADATPVGILSLAQDVAISITNGLGGETAAPAVLHVTASPIVYAVTDAAALVEPAAGASPKFAPYEIVTIFGDNFGPTAGTPVLGTLDGSSRFPSSLTAGGTPLTVAFNKQDGTLIANAYLLFASNNQINALVPSGITGTGITGLQIVVTNNSHNSAIFSALPTSTNPGIFTTASSGQGQGAILLSNYTVNSNTSSTTKATKGGTVLIYVSGMGAPNSTSPDTASTSAAKYPGSCVALSGTTGYVTTAGLSTPATVDGAVILSADIATNKLPPCFGSSPAIAVTIGGQTATVTYAGWVADSVAGLYQINATVPTKAPSGASVPVVVSVGGVPSQAGVTMAIN